MTIADETTESLAVHLQGSLDRFFQGYFLLKYGLSEDAPLILLDDTTASAADKDAISDEAQSNFQTFLKVVAIEIVDTKWKMTNSAAGEEGRQKYLKWIETKRYPQYLEYHQLLQESRDVWVDLIRQSMNKKSTRNTKEERAIAERRVVFIQERDAILAEIPDENKKLFQQVGFAKQKQGKNFRYYPAMCVSPFSLPPVEKARQLWMESFEKQKSSGVVPHLIYWIGEGTYSVLPPDRFVSYDEGIKLDLDESLKSSELSQLCDLARIAPEDRMHMVADFSEEAYWEGEKEEENTIILGKRKRKPTEKAKEKNNLQGTNKGKNGTKKVRHSAGNANKFKSLLSKMGSIKSLTEILRDCFDKSLGDAEQIGLVKRILRKIDSSVGCKDCETLLATAVCVGSFTSPLEKSIRSGSKDVTQLALVKSIADLAESIEEIMT